MKELLIWLNKAHTQFRLLKPIMRPMRNHRGNFIPMSWLEWAEDVAHDIEPNHFGIQLSDV